MIRRHPSVIRTETLCPYTALFRSMLWHVRDGYVRPGRQLDQIAGLDPDRPGDAVEPADGHGARAGFQPSDRLRCRRRVTAVGDVLEGHLLRAADFADAGDHFRPHEPQRLFLFTTCAPKWQDHRSGFR